MDLDAGAADMEKIAESHKTYDDIFAPAESFQLDDVIDPNETRERVIRVLKATRNEYQPVSYKHGIMP